MAIFKTSDTSHYGKDGPWVLPEGWVWATIGDIFLHNTGKALNASDMDGERLTYITTSNLYWDRFELTTLKEMLFTKSEIEKCTACKGDLLVCEGGDIGRAAIWQYDYDIRIQNHIHRLRGLGEVNHRLFLFWFMYLKVSGLIGGKGIGLMGLSSGELDKLEIPIPPLKEQERIVNNVDNLFIAIRKLDGDCSLLMTIIEQSKSKILDLAIHGKLVPQDPADKPAIELLKQVNPEFQPSHNLHYEGNIPNGWQLVSFEDIFRTIPSKMYQISMKEITEKGQFPVISQGAKYIDGYSNNSHRVFNVKEPIIIFGDHSKVLKYVEHDFIVGADGVKILSPRWVSKYLYYHLMFSVSTLENRGYSRNFQFLSSKSFLIPPFEEQCRIVSAIEEVFAQLDFIAEITT